MMETGKESLRWTEVEDTAGAIFRVWADQPELKWAKKAWAVLAKAGMTSYDEDSEPDKHRVLVRLLTLARLYREFCLKACEETFSMEDLVQEWRCAAEAECELDLFWVGYCAGVSGAEPSGRDFTISSLVASNRGEVVAALIKGFGNKNVLFASLWCSMDTETASLSADEAARVALVEPDLEDGRMDAFAWIDQGMEALESDDCWD